MRKTAIDGFRFGRKALLVGLVVLALVGSFVALFLWEKNQSYFSGVGSTGKNDVFLEHDGISYRKRNHTETVLVIGLDKFSDDTDQSSYNNDQQADFLMLLMIDHEQKTCTALHLNRDTMADVTVLGVGGKPIGTVNQQLALAHTYGSGGEDSCENTVKAVSALLYGLPIDHYVSMTMDAVQILNDLVGGVTVRVLDDMTDFDPALKKDETVTLKGEQSLIYVRNRYGLEDSSNAHRMERQRQYLQELFLQTVRYIEKNESFSSEAKILLSDCMISNCTLTQMDAVFEDVVAYGIESFHSLEGENVVGEKFMEFYPNEDAAKELIIDLLCEESE